MQGVNIEQTCLFVELCRWLTTDDPERVSETPADMSLRHTEMHLRHAEGSLPDYHTVHEPLPPIQYIRLFHKE